MFKTNPGTFILFAVLSVSCSTDKSSVPVWGFFEKEVIAVKEYADPFRDIDLLVSVKRPDGTAFSQFGFYDGCNKWKFRIMPDMEGQWQFSAVFSDSSDSVSGKFSCINKNRSGPLAIYPENPVWPVFKGSEPKQVRSFHTGDRLFASNFSDDDRKRFLDWIGRHGYNLLSVGSHYLNRQQEGRGKTWDTPRLWPPDPAEYERMESILLDLEERNIYVHPFAGFFGRAAEWPIDHEEQELYIRYTLARISSFRNIILNVGGPEPLLKPEEYQKGNMTRDDINRVALLIKKYDPYGHMLSVHNRTSNGLGDYERDPFIFEKWEDYATLQGGKSTDLKDVYNFITQSRKVIKPVFAHEVMWYGNMYHENLDPENLRKKAVTLLMAGSFINFGDMDGNSSSGFSGHLNPDSANTEAHNAVRTIWDIFDSIPFHELAPRPDLIDGAFCLSDGQNKHLVYIPDGKYFSVKTGMSSSGRWINPRNGEEKTAKIDGSDIKPPDNGDWLFWIDETIQ